MESKCPDETLHMGEMNLTLHFAHARRHLFAGCSPYDKVVFFLQWAAFAIYILQSTLITSKSKGFFKMLGDILTMTCQICRTEGEKKI